MERIRSSTFYFCNPIYYTSVAWKFLWYSSYMLEYSSVFASHLKMRKFDFLSRKRVSECIAQRSISEKRKFDVLSGIYRGEVLFGGGSPILGAGGRWWWPPGGSILRIGWWCPSTQSSIPPTPPSTQSSIRSQMLLIDLRASIHLWPASLQKNPGTQSQFILTPLVLSKIYMLWRCSHFNRSLDIF